MNTVPSLHSRCVRFCRTLLAAALVAAPALGLTTGPAALALLDDFSDAQRTSTGAERLLIDDAQLGSQSHGTQTCAESVLTVKGSLVPGRGVPAFMSLVLLTTPDGQPQDLSTFEGIRLRVKVGRGILSVQAGSSEIDNFDYHSSAIQAKAGEFQEVRIPFSSMRRAWSEQTTLNLKTITSINVVAFGMAKGDFAYELDEIGFY